MNEVRLIGDSIGRGHVEAALKTWIDELGSRPRKVLLIPPDLTRSHSQAGPIVQILYKMLASDAQVDIMPALGTHVAMSAEENASMFGTDIPSGRFLVHNWRTDVVKIGEVPAS